MSDPLDPERDLSTLELVRRAIEEARLLARAEVAHARIELKEELRMAIGGAALFAAAVALLVCGLSVIFVAIALALPLGPVGACVLVGCILLVIAAGVGAVAYRLLPKRPLEHTRRSLEADVAAMRERLA